MQTGRRFVRNHEIQRPERLFRGYGTRKAMDSTVQPVHHSPPSSAGIAVDASFLPPARPGYVRKEGRPADRRRRNQQEGKHAIDRRYVRDILCRTHRTGEEDRSADKDREVAVTRITMDAGQENEDEWTPPLKG